MTGTAFVGDATKAQDALGCRPNETFHEIVIAFVESDSNKERNA